MSTQPDAHRYGKQSVPVFKVRKDGLVHEVIDMMVDITLEGTVADSWLKVRDWLA